MGLTEKIGISVQFMPLTGKWKRAFRVRMDLGRHRERLCDSKEQGEGGGSLRLEEETVTVWIGDPEKGWEDVAYLLSL